jgi:hypothetical protein
LFGYLCLLVASFPSSHPKRFTSLIYAKSPFPHASLLPSPPLSLSLSLSLSSSHSSKPNALTGELLTYFSLNLLDLEVFLVLIFGFFFFFWFRFPFTADLSRFFGIDFWVFLDFFGIDF